MLSVGALMNKLSWFFFDKYPSDAADVIVSIPTIVRLGQTLVRMERKGLGGGEVVNQAPHFPVPRT